MNMNSDRNNIAIIGAGYVGASLSALLAENNDVLVIDTDETKVNKINRKESPIPDKDIENFYEKKDLSITASANIEDIKNYAQYIILCLPTNYDDNKKEFDTQILDQCIDRVINLCKDSLIIIKSTIPIGYTKAKCEYHKTTKIAFSPEFLREGRSIEDNQNPSRIILGACQKLENEDKKFLEILKSISSRNNQEVMIMSSEEAEAVKLFANTYLALRVAFFNELDSYCMLKELSSRSVIEGICADSRIGNYYNNPSFGYGGYCLPKDTMQLHSQFKDISQATVSASILSNRLRKQHIVNEIIRRKPKKLGVFRLEMKKGSSNFRHSAILDILNELSIVNIDILVFDENLDSNKFLEIQTCSDFEEFKKGCDLILTNRYDKKLDCVKDKVFTRDIFGEN